MCCGLSVFSLHFVANQSEPAPAVSSAPLLGPAVGCRNVGGLREIQKSGLNLVEVNKVNSGKIQGEITLRLKK